MERFVSKRPRPPVVYKTDGIILQVGEYWESFQHKVHYLHIEVRTRKKPGFFEMGCHYERRNNTKND